MRLQLCNTKAKGIARRENHKPISPNAKTLSKTAATQVQWNIVRSMYHDHARFTPGK